MDYAPENVESLVEGSEKLTNIFGYWPSFHDAEVIELHLWRPGLDPDRNVYDLPVLTLKMHLWEITDEVSKDGYLILRHHTLARLRFFDVEALRMDGFNASNFINLLSITQEQEGGVDPFTYFEVDVKRGFGMSAWFRCRRIEVVDALPCDAKGKETG